MATASVSVLLIHAPATHARARAHSHTTRHCSLHTGFDCLHRVCRAYTAMYDAVSGGAGHSACLDWLDFIHGNYVIQRQQLRRSVPESVLRDEGPGVCVSHFPLSHSFFSYKSDKSAREQDCRIGADAGPKWLAGYQAVYPWTLAMNASGNRYQCGTPVPSCIVSGGVCNHTSAPHPGQEVTGSPVKCV